VHSVAAAVNHLDSPASGYLQHLIWQKSYSVRGKTINHVGAAGLEPASAAECQPLLRMEWARYFDLIRLKKQLGFPGVYYLGVLHTTLWVCEERFIPKLPGLKILNNTG